MDITNQPRIKIIYVNEFGDETSFETSLSQLTTIDNMQVAFCRFLLAAGWDWENVKEYHPDYMYTNEHK